MMTMMPPEAKEIPGGQDAVAKSLTELGPMTGKEIAPAGRSRSSCSCFWATEGVLHSFDSSTTTTIAVALLFLPGIGVMDWKKRQSADPVGHDRAVRRRHQPRHGAAADPGRAVACQPHRGLVRPQSMPSALGILAVMAAFLVVVHLGFASATALASSLIPIVIAVLQKVQTPGINVLGMTLVLQFVVSFGFILPVNSPQGMVAYGTETFVARDFVRTGIVITVLAYLLTLLLGATYWRWLGYV